MANQNTIVVDIDEDVALEDMNTREEKLASWIMGKVGPWADYRDSKFETKWDEYYRLWRGIWAAADKTTDSERSRIITPAIQQAIEATVAELEEATFGKGRWFDVSDDVQDQQREDMEVFRKLLLEDLDDNGVPSAISEVFLNGAIYGTGIGKVVIEDGVRQTIESGETEKFAVKLLPVHPKRFAIDPTARTIDEALGCAHIMIVPKHTVVSKQFQGIYDDIDLGGFPDNLDLDIDPEELRDTDISQKTKLIEYHGLVPASLLSPEVAEDEELVDFEGLPATIDEDDLVEAIVTIANDTVLLRANENPLLMKDRAFIAYQHDTVPESFWGRGVTEKGYNAQKALDAEVRARIDAMALSIRPMMGIDATRIPRGGQFSVRPGKAIFTNGDPSQILKPFNFGQVNNNTFTQAGELERMVQMSTGAMDSATPTGVSPRNNTASGMSMMLSGAIKRSKRTMANIERTFTTPLIHKAAWRYIQFEPERYKATDVKFTVHSTLGIMAREFEQQQLTGLLATVPPNSPAYWLLLRSIYENSSMTNKEEMLQIVGGMLQQALNPQPPQPTIEEQLKAQDLQMKAQNEQARIRVEFIRAQAEMVRVDIEMQKADSDEAKKMASAMLDIAKAEAEELGTQLDFYKTTVDALKAQSTGEANATRSTATV